MHGTSKNLLAFPLYSLGNKFEITNLYIIYMCVCVYIYAHIYTHTRIYIYIYTRRSISFFTRLRVEPQLLHNCKAPISQIQRNTCTRARTRCERSRPCV